MMMVAPPLHALHSDRQGTTGFHLATEQEAPSLLLQKEIVRGDISAVAVEEEIDVAQRLGASASLGLRSRVSRDVGQDRTRQW